MRKAVIKEHRTTIVDHVTGEVSQDITETAEVVNLFPLQQEPPFVKVYLNDLSQLSGLQLSLQPLLFELVKRITWDGVVSLSTGARDKICKELSISRQTLRNRMTMLTKKDIFIATGGSEYLANPQYFGRGEWKHILTQKKDFEMKIRYKANGERELTTCGIDPEKQQQLL